MKKRIALLLIGFLCFPLMVNADVVTPRYYMGIIPEFFVKPLLIFILIILFKLIVCLICKVQPKKKIFEILLINIALLFGLLLIMDIPLLITNSIIIATIFGIICYCVAEYYIYKSEKIEVVNRKLFNISMILINILVIAIVELISL